VRPFIKKPKPPKPKEPEWEGEFIKEAMTVLILLTQSLQVVAIEALLKLRIQ
jgi:hypothetical protein